FGGMRGDGFVVKVKIGQSPPRLGERPKTGRRLHRGNAGEFFAQIIGVAGPVFGGMEQAVNVIKEILLADRLVRISGLEMREPRVADSVAAGVAIGRGRQRRSGILPLFFGSKTAALRRAQS